MHRDQRQAAILRIQQATLPSDYSTKAIQMLQQVPSEAALLAHLSNTKQTPPALEALCALQSNEHETYTALRQAISANQLLSWSLVESLNRLSWYNAIRAYLSLPEPPERSSIMVPFIMLARNKFFEPADMGGILFRYHVMGLWALLSTNKQHTWQYIHPTSLAVIDQLRQHLERSNPDPFVVYLAALLLGDIAPLPLCRQSLILRTGQTKNHPLIGSTAKMVLACLPCPGSPAH